MSDIPNRTYVVEGRKPHPDLLKEVREGIDAAKENGYDFFGDPERVLAGWTDEAIADDMDDCSGIGALYDRDDVIAAVAAVRAERA